MASASPAASPAKPAENAAAAKIQAAFKGHDVRKGALNLGGHKKAGSMTMKRQDHAAMEQQMRAMECSQWIGTTVGSKVLTDAKDQNDFFHHLSDGVALCQLIEKINKSIGITYRANAKTGSFPARDNIVNFIDAAKKLGVNPITLFDPEDLVARKHDKMVINCLLQLAKIAAIKYKITPPSIVQYEIEIEELEQKRKAGTLKEDEDDLDDEEVTTSREKSASVIAPPSPATATAAAASDAKVAPASPAVAPATPSKEPEPIASPAAAAATTPAATPEPVKAAAAVEAPAAAAATAADAAPAKTAEPAAAAAAGGKKSSKSDKPKYAYLPYVPNPESDIDGAVAKILNNNLFDIDCKAVDIKKKKRNRTAKQVKAEYIIAHHRVHVRKIQGVVMVHVGADWISFARFAEDLVAKAAN